MGSRASHPFPQDPPMCFDPLAAPQHGNRSRPRPLPSPPPPTSPPPTPGCSGPPTCPTAAPCAPAAPRQRLCGQRGWLPAPPSRAPIRGWCVPPSRCHQHLRAHLLAKLAEDGSFKHRENIEHLQPVRHARHHQCVSELLRSRINHSFKICSNAFAPTSCNDKFRVPSLKLPDNILWSKGLGKLFSSKICGSKSSCLEAAGQSLVLL